MKATKHFLVILSLVCFISNEIFGATRASSESQSSGSKIHSTAVIFVGSVTTYIARKRSTLWFFIGWFFIVGGTLSSASKTITDILMADNTEIQFYSGQDKPEQLETKIGAKPFLEKIEIDSIVAAADPELARSLPMAEVLSQFQMAPQRVGQLIVAAKKWGDSLLNGEEFGRQITVAQPNFAFSSFEPLSKPEKHIVKNYLRLRNIKVVGI